ncbi:uncharacterized protein LOC125084336 [Lutra lutra]|uniref:uncharacterized protein LOC125084336 n=1 Tax=Lutra lutra TaxID=9657 RepID=UPI001FD4D674|nr:uncharacterized protein LOC125084336 [Lutra lutra]
MGTPPRPPELEEQRLLGCRFGNNRYQILSKYVTGGLAQLRATPAPALHRLLAACRLNPPGKTALLRARPHVLLSRKTEAAPGPVDSGRSVLPDWRGSPGRSRPILARHCEEDTFLECPAWAQLPPPQARPGPPTHPPCTRKARARPPRKEATLPGKQEQHSVAVSLKVAHPPSSPSWRWTAVCTVHSPCGAGPWSSEQRAKPTYRVGAGPRAAPGLFRPAPPVASGVPGEVSPA